MSLFTTVRLNFGTVPTVGFNLFLFYFFYLAFSFIWENIHDLPNTTYNKDPNACDINLHIQYLLEGTIQTPHTPCRQSNASDAKNTCQPENRSYHICDNPHLHTRLRWLITTWNSLRSNYDGHYNSEILTYKIQLDITFLQYRYNAIQWQYHFLW